MSTAVLEHRKCGFNPEILKNVDIDLKRSLLQYLVENRILLMNKLMMAPVSLETKDIIITLFSQDDFIKLLKSLDEMIG